MAPQVGLEPTTLRLTAGCSAIELLRSVADCGTADWPQIHHIKARGRRENFRGYRGLKGDEWGELGTKPRWEFEKKLSWEFGKNLRWEIWEKAELGNFGKS